MPVLLGTYESIAFTSRKDVVADPAAGLVYFLTNEAIWIYDLVDLRSSSASSPRCPEDNGQPRDLVQWGEGALAYSTLIAGCTSSSSTRPTGTATASVTAGTTARSDANPDQADTRRGPHR